MSLSSQHAERSFQDSLNKFQTRLTSRERDMFKFTTLNDLRQTILRIQSEQAAKSKAMHLARLQRFLEGFDQFGKIIEVFLNSSEFVAFVWGPMKFILQVASNYADAFDILLAAYEQIGESLPLLQQYRSLFSGNTHMQIALAKIYEDILEFHRRALRFFTLPTWQQLFRSIWRDFKSRFERILEDLCRHKTLIESQATYLHFEQYQADRLYIRDKFDRDEQMERKQVYMYILQWASPADSRADHKDVEDERQKYPGTGTWLLRDSGYRSWREDSVPRSSMLWLNGIPGAGKTYLVSTAIDDCKHDSDAKTAFFYCKQDDPQRNTCAAILRTLLCQLLEHGHDLLPWLYDQCITSGLTNLSSVEICKRLLKTMLLDAKKVYLIIDGLDECERGHRKEFINILNDLIDACDALDPGKLRIMLASQDESDIRKTISFCAEIRLKTTDIEKDIEIFAQAWCKRIQEKFDVITDEDADLICRLTCERADGMFLFARLVMNNLYNQISLEKLIEQIDPSTFPKGLDQAYDRIMRRMQDRSQSEQSAARTILGWMTCARRPLKWHEIQAISSIDVHENEVDFASKKIRVHIREICGSLITQLSSDRVELVHTSAKRYLIHCQYLQLSFVEYHLATLCIKYLTFECFDRQLSPEQRHKYLVDGYYAFQDYAVAHWSDHLAQAIKTHPESTPTDGPRPMVLLGSAITDFVAQYQLSEQGNVSPDQKFIYHDHFERAEFLDDLRYVLTYVERQKVGGIQALDEIGLKPLDEVVHTIRRSLESLAQPQISTSETERSLIMLYGQDWFKCDKVTCHYFYAGFPNSQSRQSHKLRHEKPFRCPIQDCESGYKLGFTAKKDLDRHTLLYHPEHDQAMLKFSRLKKTPTINAATSYGQQKQKETKHPAKWGCPNCSKTFTRRNILESHKLTHQNAKPFDCDICGKRFVRDNDRRRHENGHSEEKKLICTAVCGLPLRDHGCGKVFMRRDMLAKHWKGSGKKCIAPLLEEKKIHEEWTARLEKSRVDGSMLPIPGPLLQQYPDLELSNWHEVLGSQEDGKAANNVNEMAASSPESRESFEIESGISEELNT